MSFLWIIIFGALWWQGLRLLERILQQAAPPSGTAQTVPAPEIDTLMLELPNAPALSVQSYCASTPVVQSPAQLPCPPASPLEPTAT